MGNSVEVTLARHDSRITVVEERTKQLVEDDKVVTDLRVELGKLQMQIKVTWALLMLVIGGLVSVAFALLQRGV